MGDTSTRFRWPRFTLLGLIKVVAGVSAAVGAFAYGLRIDHRSDLMEFTVVMAASTGLGIWSFWDSLKA